MGAVQADISISLDGFVTRPNTDQHPGLGEGGRPVPWRVREPLVPGLDVVDRGRHQPRQRRAHDQVVVLAVGLVDEPVPLGGREDLAQRDPVGLTHEALEGPAGVKPVVWPEPTVNAVP